MHSLLHATFLGAWGEDTSFCTPHTHTWHLAHALYCAIYSSFDFDIRITFMVLGKHELLVEHLVFHKLLAI